jgi:hypothetical protein
LIARDAGETRLPMISKVSPGKDRGNARHNERAASAISGPGMP